MARFPNLFRRLDQSDPPIIDTATLNRHTEALLERHKREGLALAVSARWIALAVVAVMLPILNPRWDVLYYEALLLAMAGVGWLQSRVGEVGRSRRELLVLMLDIALMTFIIAVPNPFAPEDWPSAVVHRFGGFDYFYVLLAAATLAYSWRTIISFGVWTAAIWGLVAGSLWLFGHRIPGLSDAVAAAVGDRPYLARMLDPNSILLDLRIQEVVVFLIVSVILAMTVRRFSRLLLNNAQLERERENLSRYFSPNVVEQLSQNDEPLKQTRTHDVAVLFVDIVGFTTYAASHDPQQVIATLRGFHARMEAEVFRHGGTLDKYLGDGMMATFGTPVPSEQDAINALRCVRAMRDSLARWNAERALTGEPPILGSFGLHFGPVVLGDIGANRLEFAVLGNTVNVASRIEKLTRPLVAEIALSEQMRARAEGQCAPGDPALDGLFRQAPQAVRGIEEPVTVWTLSRPENRLH
ncbi:MAG: adenylate/guanylate cyclase domain-containing protein [Pseudooceanicola sp.]|nr:adenylate/guanylate cyclase domain-containing protein [Pseudooceanicola sp.]